MSDLAAIREAMMDKHGRRVCSLGLVVADDDGGAHFDVTADDDIIVRVELQPEERPVWCRLSGMAAGRGVGMIPAIGDEVVVVTPGGDIHADPIIIGILSTGSSSDDMATRTVVVAGNNVKITALGSGTVSVNGGSTSIPKLGDSVSVSIPGGYTDGLGASHPLTTSLSGTITSATAGDSRLKG